MIISQEKEKAFRPHARGCPSLLQVLDISELNSHVSFLCSFSFLLCWFCNSSLRMGSLHISMQSVNFSCKQVGSSWMVFTAGLGYLHWWSYMKDTFQKIWYFEVLRDLDTSLALILTEVTGLTNSGNLSLSPQDCQGLICTPLLGILCCLV